MFLLDRWKARCYYVPLKNSSPENSSQRLYATRIHSLHFRGRVYTQVAICTAAHSYSFSPDSPSKLLPEKAALVAEVLHLPKSDLGRGPALNIIVIIIIMANKASQNQIQDKDHTKVQLYTQKKKKKNIIAIERTSYMYIHQSSKKWRNSPANELFPANEQCTSARTREYIYRYTSTEKTRREVVGVPAYRARLYSSAGRPRVYTLERSTLVWVRSRPGWLSKIRAPSRREHQPIACSSAILLHIYIYIVLDVPRAFFFFFFFHSKALGDAYNALFGLLRRG